MSLSPTQEAALKIIAHDGEVVRQRDNSWSGQSGEPVGTHTVLALFDRRLVKIRCSSRRTKAPFLSAVLTELGERVARDLARETLAQVARPMVMELA